MFVVIVVVLLIPITLPLRGETNTMQSLLSSAMFTRDVIFASAFASLVPEGPAMIKSMICDSGSSTNSYALPMSTLVIVYCPADTV